MNPVRSTRLRLTIAAMAIAVAAPIGAVLAVPQAAGAATAVPNTASSSSATSPVTGDIDALVAKVDAAVDQIVLTLEYLPCYLIPSGDRPCGPF
jgi:hypothetical protein